MFKQSRHKKRSDGNDESSSSSSHRHHRHTSSSHRSRQPHQGMAGDYYTGEADFAFRPDDTYDASQPIAYGNPYYASEDDTTTIPCEMLNTMLRKSERLDMIDALLADAANTFAQYHAGIRGSDAGTVLETLLNAAVDGSHGASNASDADSVISDATTAIPDTSNLRVVIMTKSEHRSWLRLSGLNSTGAGVQSGVGRSDWLQPMRHALSDVALSTKRLEMRFGAEHMETAIQQQHNLERLTIESQYFDGMPLGSFGASAKATLAPRSASVIIAQLTDELSILSARLVAVQLKAEAGTVPYCGHVMDLGYDTVSTAHSSGLSKALSSTIVDPRTAHFNANSGGLTIQDVAKGYTIIGLTADTLKSYTPSSRSGSTGLSPLELASYTWSRCDDHIRRMLGDEPQTCPDLAQPASLLGQWLYASSHSHFHKAQVCTIGTIVEMARQYRARGICNCASAGASSSSSSRSAGKSSSSSSRTHRDEEKHRHRSGKESRHHK